MLVKQRFDQLINEVVKWYFRFDPFIATLSGNHDYDHLVPDVSEEAMQNGVKQARSYLDELKQLDQNELCTYEKIDYRLTVNLLNTVIRKIDHKLYEKNPGDVPGMLMGVAYLMLTRDYAPLPERIENLLKRLRQSEALLGQSRAVIKNPPEIFTQIAVQEAQGGLLFFEGMKQMLAAQAGDMGRAACEVIDGTLAAYQNHLVWLKELLPQSNGAFAIGEELFTEMLQQDHMLEYTVETLLARGWEIFNDTREQMEQLARVIDPKRSWEAILQDLKQEHPTSEELLPYYRAELARVKQFVIEQGIVDIPHNEVLAIEETPVFQRSMLPYAAYMPPAPFEAEQVGHFWVTPVDQDSPVEVQEEKLQGHSIYKIPITTLHEGYPGHHLQLVWANTTQSVVRKLTTSTLFAEGWAFYCEELLEQMGYISDPRTKLTRLKDQLWRAARIIIDSSIHTQRMTFEEAVDFLVEKAHLERTNAIGEVSRYTLTPTQPMSYLIGKLEILKLVAEYRQKVGAKFCLREFHNKLLSYGTIPPALVRESMLSELG